VLLVDGITKRFGKREVLHEIRFQMDKGVLGILGPNGAGKTTLLRILATVFHPSSGDIKLDELKWSKDVEEIRKQLGYLPQNVGLFPALSVYEYLDYVGSLRGLTDKQKRSESIDKVLEEVNLVHKKNEKVKNLSGGMKQRLGIAQAIIHNPGLLLVDEPTAGLDPEERIRFRSLLRELALDRIVLLSTHITEDISVTCDKLCMMKNGTLQFFDALIEVTRMAANKVWKVDATPEEFSRMRSNKEVHIVSASETDANRLALRIISDDKPNGIALPGEPTLEEGYMIWLKGN
jgi:ABC-2 type transport system ATP-binding protein